MRGSSLRTALLVFILSSAIALPAQNSSSSAQSSSPDEIFTLNVDKPTAAKDVQVRYFFTGEFGGYGSSVADTVGNHVVIKTGVEGKSAKTFKLIAYAPGCQLVTLSVDDLSTSNRQGDFQCQKLSTLQLRGRIDTLSLSQKHLEVQALYRCDWAMPFFGIGDGAISPLTLGKAKVDEDGTFTIDVPDFTADPSFPRISGNAGFSFLLMDAKSGKPVASLTSLSDSSHGGVVPVAASYPELAFAVESH